MELVSTSAKSMIVTMLPKGDETVMLERTMLWKHRYGGSTDGDESGTDLRGNHRSPVGRSEAGLREGPAVALDVVDRLDADEADAGRHEVDGHLALEGGGLVDRCELVKRTRKYLALALGIRITRALAVELEFDVGLAEHRRVHPKRLDRVGVVELTRLGRGARGGEVHLGSEEKARIVGG